MDKNSKAKDTRLKRYLEWSKEYPAHLVLMRSGYFYSAWGRAAEVLNEILDYNLSYSEGSNIPFTGGPNLDKILRALEKNCINYIVVAKNEIVEKQEFQFCKEVFYQPDENVRLQENDAPSNYDIKVGTELQTKDSAKTFIVTKINDDTVQLLHKGIIDSPPAPGDFEGKVYTFNENEFIIIVDLTSDSFTALYYKTIDKEILKNLHPKKSSSKKEKTHPGKKASSYNYLNHYQNTVSTQKTCEGSASHSPINRDNIPHSKMDGSPYSEPTYSRSRSSYDRKRNRKKYEGTGK